MREVIQRSYAPFMGDASFPTVSRIEVPPFHQMGEKKWNRLAIPYPLRGVHPPDPAVLERVRDQFRARGLTAL